MPYEFENTTPVYELYGGDENTPWPNKYDKAYETVRPTCHYDIKKIDYFVPSSSTSKVDPEIIENGFESEGVTYDYFEDYGKWEHVEENPPYPMDLGPGGVVPVPGVFTQEHESYGFNYSSKMGIGNRKYNWLSHTDLDLNIFKIIRDKIRKPVLKAVKEAKQRQDILGACRVQKYFKKVEEKTGNPSPTFPELKYYYQVPEEECQDPNNCPDVEVIVDCFAEPPDEGYPEDCPPTECQDWSCKKLEEVINSIPLECVLIAEHLGPEYQGVNLDKYWWEGYSLETEGGLSATKEALSVANQTFVNIDIPEGYHGTTFQEPQFSQSHPEPPYQHLVGIYKCPAENKDDSDILLVGPNGEGEPQYPDLEGIIKRPEGEFPWYGAFGGYTADPCGCISIEQQKQLEGEGEGEGEEESESSILPEYITSCNWPNIGEKFPEYLQYIGSEDVRYWNTPYETPLYRKAQMQLLFSSEVEIETPGDFNIKVGSIINAIFPVAVNNESPSEVEANQLNGKWLVVKIKHIFQAPSLHKMRLTCVRDSKYSSSNGGSFSS